LQSIMLYMQTEQNSKEYELIFDQIIIQESTLVDEI